MHGPTSTEGPSTVESGPSAQSQYSSHNYPPPPPAAFAAQGYPSPAPFSFRESGPGTSSAPRQRSSIACRYCRRRKIRCSGRDSPDGKCQNCSRMNQECIFQASSSTAFVPQTIPPNPEAIPPRELTYGSFRQWLGQAQHQYHDIRSSEYRANRNPDLAHYYPPQNVVFPPPDPPPDQQGGYGDDRRTSLRRRQDDSDSVKAYAARGKFFGADIATPINSEPIVDDSNVSAPWESQSASSPGKPVQTLQDASKLDFRHLHWRYDKRMTGNTLNLETALLMT
ncbi:hypothetical protein H9Q72_006532 [Fusarium xylarioides]|uniref:Zn(2)-C6 fungal-type domain-containing protein n=1 Tax=Fusarium xylarioides TaxID=221167 RepID=A0A9P7L5S9_9HYPO|nr:hypothetical protein H9Q70_006813 [Fusarium xylarioides]KAG5765401.1 hypothetical protein H9Q72_006532 [Fusarium xylarioides]